MIFFFNFKGFFIERIIRLAQYAHTDLMNGPMKPDYPVEMNQFCTGYLIGYLQCLSEQEDDDD